MVKPLIIKNARIWDGATFVRRELYTAERIAAHPRHDAVAVDLDGYAIFPGLINAHDHLELNHFPRTKFRDTYDNAHQWGNDVSARLNDEPYKSLRAYPLWDRLFIGGLKNLLCGATTVAHHNPPHKELFRADFPVRVLKRYGWAHSLHFSTSDEIVRSYRTTPPDVPWFIHLAEGTDEIAAGEYQRLKALGCVGANTVIVHGVGLTNEDIADAAPRVRGLVICPTTNVYLLGETANEQAWLDCGGHVAYGSDSRLTADGDLLTELRRWTVALQTRMMIMAGDRNHAIFSSYWHIVFPHVYTALYKQAAMMLQLPDAETAEKPAPNGDWIAFNTELHQFGYLPRTRADLALVVRGGVPQIGDPDLILKFPVESVPATLDGKPKRINIDLARQIARCSLHEAGLELDALPNEKRKTIIGFQL
ncbi:MAG: hypothetical protein SGI73_09385 [Chloroflexota bacterium]|nr:hypothetical protein [Chloroflexota bacterium]